MKKNNVVLKDALDDTEKKLDHVELSVNHGESQVKRLSKQIEELQKTANVSQEGEECKDPELAFSEVSGRTFSGIVNRDHVSEANFSSRNVGESLSRVVFGSLVVNSSSVHVERSNPILEKPAPVPVSTLQENPLCFSDSSISSCNFSSVSKQQRRISQREIPCSRRKGIEDQQIPQRGSIAVALQSKTVNTCPKLTEECKVGPDGWVEQNFGQRMWFCQLSRSPDSCICAFSSNEGDEEDFHYGALIDRANQRKLLSQKSEKVTTAFVRVIKNWVVYHRTSKCQNPRLDLRTRIDPSRRRMVKDPQEHILNSKIQRRQTDLSKHTRTTRTISASSPRLVKNHRNPTANLRTQIHTTRFGQERAWQRTKQLHTLFGNNLESEASILQTTSGIGNSINFNCQS